MGFKVPLISMVAVALLVGTACGGPSTGQTSPAFTVEFIGALTGANAAVSSATRDGMQGYFYYLNHQGGVNGHPVNLVQRDDLGSDLAKAQAAFVEMRDQIKPSAFAMATSADLSVVVPQANDAQIPLITQNAATLDQVGKYNYLYLTGLLLRSEISAQIGYLKTHVAAGTVPKIALFVSGSPIGESLKVPTATLMGQLGWGAPVDIETLPLAQPLTDLVPVAQRVVNAKADYVIGMVFGNYSVPVWRALQQVGFKGKVIAVAGGGAFSTLKQIASPDYLTTGGFNYLQPGSEADVKTITDAVVAAGGATNLDNSVTAGWTLAAVMAAGLQKCGYPCSGQAMKQALDGLSAGNPQNAAAGPISFTSSDHLGLKTARVYVLNNGQIGLASDPITVVNPT
jgi:branched-chain amino acid transport system substrate-binding protein